MRNGILKGFKQVIFDGLRLWKLAPLIPLIAFGTEFYQHIGEVGLGMFSSREAFADLAQSPERMSWAIPKLVGLTVAMIASAQFWPTRAKGYPWWSTKIFLWKQLFIAVLLNIAISVAGIWLMQVGGPVWGLVAFAVFSIATLPILVYTAAALFGEEGWSLARSFQQGWYPAFRIGVYSVAIFVPLQWIHGQNHYLALGQNDGIVWTLMLWDSAVVALIATLLGTAIHHGFKGPSDDHKVA